MNAYAEPVVSLNLAVVVATADLGRVEELLRSSGPEVDVTRFPHSVNVSMSGSDLRVQFQTDPRYQDFLSRAETADVPGLTMPVAVVDDILRGKVWAAQDRERRPSKRQKDLADIARLLEVRPDLRILVPADVQERLVQE